MRWISYFFSLVVSLSLFSCQKETNQLFTKLSANDTGIKFKNLVRETEEFNILTYGYFHQGGGVAIGDVNNDSLPDIYFTGNMMASKLYINKGPKVYARIASDNTDVPANQTMSRLIFAEGEYSSNRAAVEAAAQLPELVSRGGNKNSTKLWWDAKP